MYLTGALVDTSGDTGSSGILASTGSGTNWINANSTSVLNAVNVGVNLNSQMQINLCHSSVQVVEINLIV